MRGRPVPAGTYTDVLWPPGGGYTSFEWTLTPELEVASPHGYFWSHQFALRGGAGGYCGLQNLGTHPRGTRKVAIFSIWEALAAEGPDVAQPFGSEGSGYQTMVGFDWTAGTAYRLRISIEGDGWWRASVEGGPIGTILVPRHWGPLDTSSVVWTEHYTPAIGRCSDLDGYCSSVVFDGFRADGSTPPRDLKDHFGDRPTCDHSRISRTASGAVRHRMGPPPPSS